MKAFSFSVLGFLVYLGCIPGSEIYQSIHWAPQNPLFMANKKNCDPGPRKLKVQLQSKFHFICPNTATVLVTSLVGVQPADMYENLWLLYNKAAFRECDTSLDPNRRLLLSCKTPMKLSAFPVLFAQYTAEPNGLVFEGGQTYYFIATSDGTESHLNRTRGGHCNDTTNKIHMKLAVYVCKKSNQTYKDPECESDVGVLDCPKPMKPTLTTTTTTDENDTQFIRTPEKQAQTGGNDRELDMWKSVAIAAMVVAFICLVLLIALVLYFRWGRRNDRVANR